MRCSYCRNPPFPSPSLLRSPFPSCSKGKASYSQNIEKTSYTPYRNKYIMLCIGNQDRCPVPDHLFRAGWFQSSPAEVAAKRAESGACRFECGSDGSFSCRLRHRESPAWGRERAHHAVGSLNALHRPWPVGRMAPRHLLLFFNLAGCSHSKITASLSTAPTRTRGTQAPVPLPCRTLRVFVYVRARARMSANVYPAPALPQAGYASSYREAGLRQRPGVSLGTREAIPEGRVTNRNCCAGAVK